MVISDLKYVIDHFNRQCELPETKFRKYTCHYRLIFTTDMLTIGNSYWLALRVTGSNGSFIWTTTNKSVLNKLINFVLFQLLDTQI